MKKISPPIIIFLLLFSCNSDNGNGTSDDNNPPDETFILENAFPNLSFSRPVDFQSPEDSSNRIFVVEQGGTIKVFPNDENSSNAETFLDVSGNINTEANEQGLLGLAFHPDFPSNGYFYVNYTPNTGLSVTSRFQVSTANPDQAAPNSELILLEIPQPFTNHNGGQLAFGPDGYLYIASGDGGSGGDPGNNAQNLSNLLGAVLRIDVDGVSNGLNYAIPTANPFVGQANAREEIYAYGFRNPWRMSFDTQTGSLWSGDVGQDEREEINVITAGGNYGWKLFEGTFCFSGDCNDSGLIEPAFEYNHNGNDQSITGGHVYRGSQTPSLAGKYIYADFIDGRIWALDATQNNPGNTLLLNSSLNISSFGVDNDNELYFCAFDGSIYRLVEEN
ncbi:PQQ-dependent sugar dehydrogenase [Flagellimonas hymeniacidonis]|uniref:PQQ-dependent sugar dehydrogenase n=1 Tax=Flagellimonas hymeniacidonis TaxID=2603628 RepID=A0A5C8V574_9FLAO|nr:PQQ-dependent sugar dehydrogenase [Flagellimonas hymeniacidonis]TXN36205.1 PQQ-dependent sugar dehydrogenase [Flagellimonas hymeniacidonis]